MEIKALRTKKDKKPQRLEIIEPKKLFFAYDGFYYRTCFWHYELKKSGR